LDLLELGLVILGRRRIADEPVDLGALAIEDERRRRAADSEPLEDRGSRRLRVVGENEDEMLIEKGMELGVAVKLLTQQSAASSATAVEIDQDELILALGLGHGLIDRPVEPALGRGGGSENQEDRKGEGFFHICLLPHYSIVGDGRSITGPAFLSIGGP
jgi:hypothetical protein